MFTGIIKGLGAITGLQAKGRGRDLTVDADCSLDQTEVGDSIAINGVCLTVVVIDKRRFKVDLSPETLAKTTFGRARIGDRVNIEHPLRLSDRIDGHLVSGHIDGTGSIKQKKRAGNATIVTVGAHASLSRYMISKGSVAVDGISLTINNCDQDSFDVSIIPHTAKLTTMGLKKTGDYVNIEVDMIGKYVERFIAGGSHSSREGKAGKSSVDMQFLEKTGFFRT